MPNYAGTLTSAKEYTSLGKLEEWVHAYLLSDGNNKGFSDGLKLTERYFFGLANMPLALFSRCCGPEPEMKYRVHPGGFERKVNALAEAVQNGADLPPMIVQYANGGFELNDGNHRFEAYHRVGVAEATVVVWITEKEDYDEFAARFGAHLL